MYSIMLFYMVKTSRNLTDIHTAKKSQLDKFNRCSLSFNYDSKSPVRRLTFCYQFSNNLYHGEPDSSRISEKSDVLCLLTICVVKTGTEYV